MSDSVDEMKKSMVAMRDLDGPDFKERMGDVKTWLSAALTDEDTCMDGFEENGSNRNKINLQEQRDNSGSHVMWVPPRRGKFNSEPLFGCEREDNIERDTWQKLVSKGGYECGPPPPLIQCPPMNCV
ncbi:hypothetical protein OSB04_026240 [Centaurea solstitialis]|uniref:Pectinesterase inhibitor domain-containing protein n=1 Tax=Centaurea solstitialis TaxID=347529 RepID=A0AA38W719_9ASTR|nr:hypothetical protein OSB04_026240 [Centaurea solstitialis]